MIALFRAVIERVKALFITTAALDLEAEFVARHAERQAELLRQADRYAEEGLHGIADHLRRRAEALDLQQPLASVLPAVEHLQDTLPSREASPPLLRLVPSDPHGRDAVQPSRSLPTPRKKGGKP